MEWIQIKENAVNRATAEFKQQHKQNVKIV